MLLAINKLFNQVIQDGAGQLGTKDSKSFQFDLEAQLSMIIASLAGIVTPWLQVLLDSGHTKEDKK